MIFRSASACSLSEREYFVLAPGSSAAALSVSVRAMELRAATTMLLFRWSFPPGIRSMNDDGSE